MDIKTRCKEIKTLLPTIYLCMKDGRTPIAAKLLAFATVAYALSPIDLIPDFVPILGYLDDLIILPLLIMGTVKLIPPALLTEMKEKSRELWKSGKPKRWYYSIPIIAIWCFLLFFLLRGFLA